MGVHMDEQQGNWTRRGSACTAPVAVEMSGLMLEVVRSTSDSDLVVAVVEGRVEGVHLARRRREGGGLGAVDVARGLVLQAV